MYEPDFLSLPTIDNGLGFGAMGGGFTLPEHCFPGGQPEPKGNNKHINEFYTEPPYSFLI
jgi:hypothetical protein